jgi:AmmeMemoRadiSam system protein A
VTLNEAQKVTLLRIARNSLAHGLRFGCAAEIDVGAMEPCLCEKRACFVTLTRERELRGCVGALEARQPLVQEVATSAFNAGFCDPRMQPLQQSELPEIHIEVSVLSPLEDLPVVSEEDLHRRLQPHVDGVVLVEGPMRVTLLPKVWENLPDPAVFVMHLKRKAGLPDSYWSPTLRFLRYRAQLLAEAGAPS